MINLWILEQYEARMYYQEFFLRERSKIYRIVEGFKFFIKYYTNLIRPLSYQRTSAYFFLNSYALRRTFFNIFCVFYIFFLCIFIFILTPLYIHTTLFFLMIFTLYSSTFPSSFDSSPSPPFNPPSDFNL